MERKDNEPSFRNAVFGVHKECSDRDVMMAVHIRMEHQIGLGERCQVGSHQGTGGN